MTQKLPTPKHKPVGSSGYLALSELKDGLVEKITNMNEFLDDNLSDDDAAKLNKIRIQEARLYEQLASLKKQQMAFKSKKMEKLYRYLRKNRWYRIDNRDNNKIILDKETGYLWQNRDNEPVELQDKRWESAKEYAKQLYLLGSMIWRLPSFHEIYKCYSSQSAPFIHENKHYWVSDDDHKTFKNGELKRRTSFYDSRFFICCSPQYASAIADCNEINLLNFFKEQKLTPVFDDDDLNETFKYFIERPELLTRVGELDNQLAERGWLTYNLQDGIDFKSRIKSYDIEEADNSGDAYCQLLIKWLDELIADLEKFEENETEIFEQADELNRTITDFQSAEPVLNERKEYLVRYLDFGLSGLYQELIQIKDEAIKYQNELRNTKALDKLKKLENKSHPSFCTIAEHSADLVSAKLKKIEWFKNNTETLQEISNLHADWAQEYKAFLVSKKTEFQENCKKKSIDDDVAQNWWHEYSHQRMLIETSLLSLLQLGLEERVELSLLFAVADKIKEQLTDRINKFYDNELIPIHQNLFGNIEAAFLEKIETQTKLGKIVLDFEEKLQEEIFKTEDKQNRIALCRWAQDWFDVSLAELTANDELINKITAETQNRFRELKKANAELFLNDAHAYAESRKKINDEFTAIMFQIKKELMPKKK